MIDARYEKQARKLRCLLRATHALLHAFIILDRALRRDQLVGEAVRNDQLAAAIAEASEVGIVGTEDGAELLGRLAEEQLELVALQRAAVVAWALCEKKLHPLERDPERLAGERRALRARDGKEVRASRVTMPETLAVARPRAVPNLPQHRRIGVGKRLGTDPHSDQYLRIPRSTDRIVDHAVRHAIGGIARRDGGGGGSVEFGFRNVVVRLLHHGLRPQTARHHAGPIDCGATGENAVIVFRIPLRLHQALAPAGGAADKIRVARRLAVKRRRERLADDGHLVDAEVGVVADLLPVEPTVGVESEGTAAALVTGVGRGGGKPLGDRTAKAIGAATVKAATAVAHETSVPVLQREGDPDGHAIGRGRMRHHGGDTYGALGLVDDDGREGGMRESDFPQIVRCTHRHDIRVERHRTLGERRACQQESGEKAEERGFHE